MCIEFLTSIKKGQPSENYQANLAFTRKFANFHDISRQALDCNMKGICNIVIKGCKIIAYFHKTILAIVNCYFLHRINNESKNK